jgi:putative oxidoreductase
MLGFLEKFKAEAYALLRIASGFMFSFHGFQKILGLYSDFHPALGSQLWFGGMIELLGGLAVLLGLQTRLAAFLCSGTMAVAYAQFHWKGQFDSQFFPALNHGETAALYAFVFLVIATQGPGKWALDKTSKA